MWLQLHPAARLLVSQVVDITGKRGNNLDKKELVEPVEMDLARHHSRWTSLTSRVLTKILSLLIGLKKTVVVQEEKHIFVGKILTLNIMWKIC